jgi:putative peptide zinc metalloprotease protein
MATKRPTFHESWYRVINLKPRLLSSVRIYRQNFRHQLWYVLENPSNNEFSRLSSQAYKFVALLDGQRTVGEVWRICNEQMGDEAITQGEVIRLLGQLYVANLLYAELPPDTQSLLTRYQIRIRRKFQGFFSNLLFVRIPLLDPNHFLDRWFSIIGKAFTIKGLVVWLVLITTGLSFVIANFRELIYQSRDVLAPSNLVWLYVSLFLVKVFHEFSHAFACKHFGKLNGSGGQVHVMGIMFLVFVPLPYVDASSAWAFRNKWHRAVVGMAGVASELLISAIAAIFWAITSTGTLHIIAYNIIFIASISTIIFNGNPLLRYDAYYVLSDLIEIPNLTQRSREYIFYLVKRYCWALKNTPNPAHTVSEQMWFGFYGIASTIYRFYISIRILVFLNRRLPEQLFILVPILAISALVMWVLVPVGRFFHFLAAGGELVRNRSRAVWSTLGGLSFLIFFLCILPAPYHIRIEGIVEPFNLAIIHAETDGFVKELLESPIKVSTDGPALIRAENPKLEAEKASIIAERRALEAKLSLAQTQEPAAAQIYLEQLEALEEKIHRIEYEVNSLNYRSPLSGTWVSSDIEKTKGIYVQHGQQIGIVGSLNNVRVRATAGQAVAAILFEQPCLLVEIRIRNRPHKPIEGKIEKILPAGLEILPSQALGYYIGGSTPTETGDPNGVKATEKFFEIRIIPEVKDPVRLLTGQRVIARITLPSKPLAIQWWDSIRQLFQRRFRI